MNGFNDKALQAIWDDLGLPADIGKQEEFERLIYEWKEQEAQGQQRDKFHDLIGWT